MAPPPPSRPGFRGTKGGGSGSASTRYQRQFGGGNKGGRSRFNQHSKIAGIDDDDEKRQEQESRAQFRRRKQAAGEIIDESFGVERFALQHQHQQQANKTTTPSPERRGWLYNMLSTTVSLYSIAGCSSFPSSVHSLSDDYFFPNLYCTTGNCIDRRIDGGKRWGGTIGFRFVLLFLDWDFQVNCIVQAVLLRFITG